MILRERRQTAGREEIMRNKTIEAISFPGDAAEWQARVDLPACFRLIALFSWDDLLATHVSAQVAFIRTYTLEKAWAALLRRLAKAGSDHDR